MEKFPHLYNEDGKVENHEVAQRMAKKEDKMRKGQKNYGKEAVPDSYIEEITHKDGIDEQFKIDLKAAVENIQKNLSPEDIGAIRELNRRGDGRQIEAFLEAISEKKEN